MFFQHSKELRSLKWGVGTLNFFDSRGKMLEKKFPHSQSTITLWEPYYISRSKKLDYRPHFAPKTSIYEVIFQLKRELVKFWSDSFSSRIKMLETNLKNGKHLLLPYFTNHSSATNFEPPNRRWGPFYNRRAPKFGVFSRKSGSFAPERSPSNII